MGKDLKGKDCGAGICQRKDKKYAARFLDKTGNRREKHLKLQRRIVTIVPVKHHGRTE